MSNYKKRKYNHRYGRSSASQQAIAHVAAYRELEYRLGPIVTDVRKEFFSLPTSKLSELFSDYEKIYGYKAAEYAQNTFSKWKSEQTKMSGQTAERLLNLVPRYIGYDTRFHMVQKLCEHHAPKLNRTIIIYPDKINEGLTEVELTLNELLEALPTVKWLPEYVIETVKWLNDDDVTITRAMLAEIDRKRADLAAITAKCCLQDIQHMIGQQNGQIKEFNHTVKLPNGILYVSLRKPEKFCFIATAVFGSTNDPTVNSLRAFRDRFLKHRKLGRVFIVLYYRYSPRLANWIAKQPQIQAVLKIILRQFVHLIEKKES